MIQIRQNTFETNSSSTHAICIDTSDFWANQKDKNYFSIWRKEAKPICVKRGDYGRCPEKPLITLQEKVDYLWTAVVDIYYDYNWDTREYLEGNPEQIKWWKEKILDELPRGSYFKEVCDDGCWGIDHAQNMRNFLIACEKEPRYIHCLLDDNSFIELGGDEYPNMIFAFLPRVEECIIPMPGKYSVYIKGN